MGTASLCSHEQSPRSRAGRRGPTGACPVKGQPAPSGQATPRKGHHAHFLAGCKFWNKGFAFCCPVARTVLRYLLELPPLCSLMTGGRGLGQATSGFPQSGHRETWLHWARAPLGQAVLPSSPPTPPGAKEHRWAETHPGWGRPPRSQSHCPSGLSQPSAALWPSGPPGRHIPDKVWPNLPLHGMPSPACPCSRARPEQLVLLW